MNQYHRLTPDERYFIEVALRSDYSSTEIARVLGRSASTITRELQRNEPLNGLYTAKYAQRLCNQRAEHSHCRFRITPENWSAVESCLREQHSPEQISGRALESMGFSISHEWIYQHVATDAKNGGDLYTNLRQGKKARRPRCRKAEDRRGQIKNRIGIEQRPAIVEDRSRVGDWEIDTIVSRESTHALVTAVERTTLATIIELMPSRETKTVTNALIRRLSPLKDLVHTVTGDNGKEFADHERIAKKLSTEFYFATPYHSWERGTNENTNGLIRQYFPKKTDFSKITKEQVRAVERKLNNRPRKSFSYKSAAEYFLERTGFPLPSGRGRGTIPDQLYNNRSFAFAA